MTLMKKLKKKLVFKKTLTYAGIGSRETPEKVLKKMTKIAVKLEKKGFTLNSGGAIGADLAFEESVENKKIFYAKDASEFSMRVGKEVHPAGHRLSEYVLKLMGRNLFQVCGKKLNKPVDFVLCWTQMDVKVILVEHMKQVVQVKQFHMHQCLIFQ